MSETATRHTEEPPEYLVGRLEDALVRDPRVGEQELEVAVEGDRVVVTGSLPTEERRQAVDEVLRELCPKHEVVNETTVTSRRGADEPEEIS